MDRTRRHIVAVLCVSLLLVSVLSAVLIVKHADHDCPGQGCGVCATIAHFGGTLKQLGTAVAVLSVAMAVLCMNAGVVLMPVIPARKSPVLLKVQMNN